MDTQQEPDDIQLKKLIEREVRIRNGAENMLKATKQNEKEGPLTAIGQELSLVNASLQMLHEGLALLGSPAPRLHKMPLLLPLPLKETAGISFRQEFMGFLADHYHADLAKHDDAMTLFDSMRAVIVNPVRSEEGILRLLAYFGQLYFIERRFFPPDQFLPISFIWYDAISGEPSRQRTIGFEKGAVLFNIAALYSHLVVMQNRNSSAGLDAAAELFQRAAGALIYIQDNFSHSPSKDMESDKLLAFTRLVLAQALECKYGSMSSDSTESDDCKEPTNDRPLLLSSLALQVSLSYAETLRVMQKIAAGYLPTSWLDYLCTKERYFFGLALENLCNAILIADDATSKLLSLPVSDLELKLTAAAHIKEATISLEEAILRHEKGSATRTVDTLMPLLKDAHSRCIDAYLEFEQIVAEENEDLHNLPELKLDKLRELLSNGKYNQLLKPISPDFSVYRVSDLFHELGPLHVFNARNRWGPPRLCTLKKSKGVGFGFSVQSDSPVVIAKVEKDSIAQQAGMRENDLIAAIRHEDTRHSRHEMVVQLIRSAGDELTLTLVTPLDFAGATGAGLGDQSRGGHQRTGSSSGGSGRASRGSGSASGPVSVGSSGGGQKGPAVVTGAAAQVSSGGSGWGFAKKPQLKREKSSEGQIGGE